MSTVADLYAELKGDIAAVSDPLFELSETLLVKNGNFLPHGVVLTDAGEVKLVAAAGENNRTNSTETLPLLHGGLRTMAGEQSLNAVGVAENVSVTFEGQPTTKAIKVLFEHRRGLTVALYRPFEKKLFKGYVFGSVTAKLTEPEVEPWSSGHA